MKLTELLCVIAIIAIVAGIIAGPVSRSIRHARSWIWGAYATQETRINAALNDDPKRDWELEHFLSQGVVPWYFAE